MRRWCARKCADVGSVNELKAVERALRIVIEFEYAHDVRMHQANAGLPFFAQAGNGLSIVGENFERDLCTRHAVCRKPGDGRATTAEPADQRVAVRKLHPFLQVLHQWPFAHPVGSGTRSGALTSAESTNPVSAS